MKIGFSFSLICIYAKLDASVISVPRVIVERAKNTWDSLQCSTVWVQSQDPSIIVLYIWTMSGVSAQYHVVLCLIGVEKTCMVFAGWRHVFSTPMRHKTTWYWAKRNLLCSMIDMIIIWKQLCEVCCEDYEDTIDRWWRACEETPFFFTQRHDELVFAISSPLTAKLGRHTEGGSTKFKKPKSSVWFIAHAILQVNWDHLQLRRSNIATLLIQALVTLISLMCLTLHSWSEAVNGMRVCQSCPVDLVLMNDVLRKKIYSVWKQGILANQKIVHLGLILNPGTIPAAWGFCCCKGTHTSTSHKIVYGPFFRGVSGMHCQWDWQRRK